MIKSIRAKLTLWYTVIMALVLVVFSIVVYSMTMHKLREQHDNNLLSALLALDVSLEGEWESENPAGFNADSLLQEIYFPNLTMAIYDNAGKMIAAKPRSKNILPANLPRKWPVADNGKLLTRNLHSAEHSGEWRIATLRVKPENDKITWIVVVAEPMSIISGQMALLRWVLFLVVPVVILLTGLVGWMFAWKLLSPVAAMTDRAKRLYAADLDERLPVYNAGDELGRLALTLNEFLGRAQDALKQERQFMADASHELRTPLFVVRSCADVILEKPQRQEDEYRDALTVIRQQARRMSRIVDDLFFLACADGKGRPLDSKDFYLDELVDETVRAARVLAEQKKIRVETIVPGEISYRGDEELIKQMLLNLLDNAIKFTPAKGVVRVQLSRKENAIEIEVIDSGSGIPADEQVQVFDRFFRGDKARSRAESAVGAGAGLGLPIARCIAESHGGSLNLRRSDSSGSVFVAHLPINGNG